MIASITGKITLIKDKFMVIETNGLGYKVHVSPDIIDRHTKNTNTEISLFIYSHIREDAFDLYGFLEYSDLEFFEMLISVSGIGPKGALLILAVASTSTLKKAIKQNDLGYLTKISGIGKKTAEKMILELRDKVGIAEENDSSLQNELDVLEALKALGYSQYQVRETLKQMDGTLDTNTKIREALKILGKM